MLAISNNFGIVLGKNLDPLIHKTILHAITNTDTHNITMKRQIQGNTRTSKGISIKFYKSHYIDFIIIGQLYQKC